jgi:hypothetical protein
MMRRAFHPARAILLAAAMAACFEDYPSQVSTVNGAYSLRTINGAALPATMPGGVGTTEILDDVITLYQGGTFVESGHSRTTIDGETTNATITGTGNYGLLGTSVTLDFDGAGDGPVRVGSIEGNTMTFVEAGVTSVFRK